MKTHLQLLQSIKMQMGISIFAVITLLMSITFHSSATLTVNVDMIGHSSCHVTWSKVENARCYVITVYANIQYNGREWGQIPGIRYDIVYPNEYERQVTVTGIGYVEIERLWTVHNVRAVNVEAYDKDDKFIENGTNIFLLQWPPPAFKGFSKISTTTFQADWSKFNDEKTWEWEKTFVEVKNMNNLTVNIHESNSSTLTSLFLIGLPSGSKFQISIKGRNEWFEDGGTKYSWSAPTVKTVYTICDAPEALAGLNIRANGFLANWKEKNGATEYKLFVKEKKSGKMIINGVSITGLSYWVEELESGFQYEYQVTAANPSGESAKSNTVFVTTTILASPTALPADNITSTSFRAKWSVVPGATKYRLEVNNGNTINYYETTELNYTLNNLTPNKNYKYKVRAFFNSHISYYGNEISLYTRPSAPTAENATNITTSSFTANWNTVSGATGYKLWVISNKNTSDNPVGYFPKTLGNIVTHTLSGLQEGHSYNYYVQAITANGESVVSNSITVVTKTNTPITYAITITSLPIEGGIVTGGGSYASGTSVTAKATAAKGYEFVNWTEGGNEVSKTASFVFSILANRTLVANFKQSVVNYSVTVSSEPMLGSTVSGGGSYASGTSVTAKATAAKGYEFVNWTEAGKEVSKLSSYVFSISANRTLVANLRSITPVYKISLAANPTEGGTVSGGGNFERGTSVTISATPKTGYDFVSWMIGANFVSSSVNHVFVATANVTYTANFKPKSWLTLSLAADPSTGGSITGAGSFEPGSSVTVNATPETGYEFVNWIRVGSGTEVSKSVTYTFTITESIALTAKFKPTTTAYLVNLSPNPAAGGVVSGGGQFINGKSVTVSATAVKSYEFVNWTEGAVIVSTSSDYTFTINSNRTLKANFQQQTQNATVTLSSNPTSGGNVSGGGAFNVGSSVTVSANPAGGYNFIHWTEGASVVSTQQNYTFSLSGNKTLTAVFALSTPAIELKSDELKVYPNPVHDVLYVEGIDKETSLRIFNITGTMVVNMLVPDDKPIDVSFLKSGVYLFIFENSAIKSTRKIVKN